MPFFQCLQVAAALIVVIPRAAPAQHFQVGLSAGVERWVTRTLAGDKLGPVFTIRLGMAGPRQAVGLLFNRWRYVSTPENDYVMTLAAWYQRLLGVPDRPFRLLLGVRAGGGLMGIGEPDGTAMVGAEIGIAITEVVRFSVLPTWWGFGFRSGLSLGFQAAVALP
jgi:hypothetical protein